MNKTNSGLECKFFYSNFYQDDLISIIQPDTDTEVLIRLKDAREIAHWILENTEVIEKVVIKDA